MPAEEGLEIVENIWRNVSQEPAGQEVRTQPDRADIVWGRPWGPGDQRLVPDLGGRRLGEVSPPQLQQDLSLHLALTTGHPTDGLQHSGTAPQQWHHVSLVLPPNTVQVRKKMTVN